MKTLDGSPRVVIESSSRRTSAVRRAPGLADIASTFRASVLSSALIVISSVGGVSAFSAFRMAAVSRRFPLEERFSAISSLFVAPRMSASLSGNAEPIFVDTDQRQLHCQRPAIATM
jgi:hypothetical protein